MGYYNLPPGSGLAFDAWDRRDEQRFEIEEHDIKTALEAVHKAAVDYECAVSQDHAGCGADDVSAAFEALEAALEAQLYHVRNGEIL